MKALHLIVGFVFLIGCLLFGYSAWLVHDVTPEQDTMAKLFAFTSVTQFMTACVMVWAACKQKKTG